MPLFHPGAAPLVVRWKACGWQKLICEGMSGTSSRRRGGRGRRAVPGGAERPSPFPTIIDARQQVARYRWKKPLPLVCESDRRPGRAGVRRRRLRWNRAPARWRRNCRFTTTRWAGWTMPTVICRWQSKASCRRGWKASTRALVVGVRDYIGKNGFPGALLGLCPAALIPALTLAVAVDALGADKVQCGDDALAVHRRHQPDRLKPRHGWRGWARHTTSWRFRQCTTLSRATLARCLPAGRVDTTEENLQSRIRGVLPMALSNKTGVGADHRQ